MAHCSMRGGERRAQRVRVVTMAETPPGAADPGQAAAPAAPRLMADCVLGSLARWLRVLGHDVAYEHAIDDDELIARCRREGRTLLTRDTRLAQRRAWRQRGMRVLLVTSQTPAEQVAQVMREAPLPALHSAALLSRCLECNEPLRPADPAGLQGKVPPYVLQTQQRFSGCPSCGRIYWRATHVRRMKEQVERLWGEPRK